MVTTAHLNSSISYPQYRTLLESLMAEGKTTGTDQSEAMVNYARLNLQRMKRIEKTIELNDELKQAIHKVSKPFTWLIITEGWCGDAAQNVPLFHLIEQANPNITVKLIMRDEHLDLMDQYLTNGGRSIPKLICLNDQGVELFTWGPRPKFAQDFVLESKSKGVAKEDMANELHAWYAKDKLQSTQNEFSKLVLQHMI